MKKIVVLSGAGISAESGISTFRDANGLWEGHDIMEVASPVGWRNNPAMVLDFYNKRRKRLLESLPNAAHFALLELEKLYDVCIITQNVDDLHERSGSKNVLHLHGELRKVRSTLDASRVYPWDNDLKLGDLCEKGSQLRPDIVWFGEEVPLLSKAASILPLADIILIVGTSMQVYPAASLVSFANTTAKIFYIDPNPQINYELSTAGKLQIIREKATVGLVQLVATLLAETDRLRDD